MMGTLAGVLAKKGVETPEDKYWAEVEGIIESVDNVLKITKINVKYHLEAPKDKKDDINEAMDIYIDLCPGAQSVINCIQINDTMDLVEQ